MTSQQITTLVKMAVASYHTEKDRDIKATAEVWSLLLSDLTFEVAKAALVKAIAGCKFFPTIADIREAAMSFREDTVPLAADAWSEVCKAMRDIGSYYGVPEFSHPLIKRAVDGMGGWMCLCASDNEMADRAHFLRMFETYRGRELEDQNTTPLIRQLVGGIGEVKNLPGGGG